MKYLMDNEKTKKKVTENNYFKFPTIFESFPPFLGKLY